MWKRFKQTSVNLIDERYDYIEFTMQGEEYTQLSLYLNEAFRHPRHPLRMWGKSVFKKLFPPSTGNADIPLGHTVRQINQALPGKAENRNWKRFLPLCTILF